MIQAISSSEIDAVTSSLLDAHFLMVVVVAIGMLMRRWDRRQVDATFMARIVMVVLGWTPEDEPREVPTENGLELKRHPTPRWVPGDPPRHAADIIEDAFGDGPLLGIKAGLAIRLAVFALAGFRLGAPFTVDEPVVTSSVPLGMMVVLLIAPAAPHVDSRTPFQSAWLSMRVAAAGLIVVAWAVASAIRSDHGWVLMMWIGLAELGVCLLVVGLWNGCGNGVRHFAMFGWVLGIVGVPFAYPNAATTQIGASLFAVLVAAALLVVYRTKPAWSRARL